MSRPADQALGLRSPNEKVRLFSEILMPQPSNGASGSNAGVVGLTPTWGTLSQMP